MEVHHLLLRVSEDLLAEIGRDQRIEHLRPQRAVGLLTLGHDLDEELGLTVLLFVVMNYNRNKDTRKQRADSCHHFCNEVKPAVFRWVGCFHALLQLQVFFRILWKDVHLFFFYLAIREFDPKGIRAWIEFDGIISKCIGLDLFILDSDLGVLQWLTLVPDRPEQLGSRRRNWIDHEHHQEKDQRVSFH